MPAGTVVGPTGVSVQPEGTAIDLQVSGGGVVRSAFAFNVANAPRVRVASRTIFTRVLVTQRARVDVTLDAKPFRRIQRWHFLHVTPGATVLRLDLAHALPPGAYRLFWKATSESGKTVERRITPVQILPARARAHVASTPQVVVVADERATQAVARPHGTHVETLTSEQAWVYATYHDVSVIVLDVDANGLQLANSLRAVFPSTVLVAISKDPAKRAAVTRAGANAVPPSSSAKLTALIGRLLAR
jgi:hypothetical protein